MNDPLPNNHRSKGNQALHQVHFWEQIELHYELINRTLEKKKNGIFFGTYQKILNQKRKEALYKSLWSTNWPQLKYVCQVPMCVI